MSNAIIVSIVIPTYNAQKYIKKTLASVLSQTYQEFEILVIDDGSTDNSASLIQSYQNEKIKYFYQENSSQAVARNKGIELASGKFIAFCDADDIWLPDKLEKQLSLFEDPEVGLTYTGIQKIDQDSQPISKQVSGKFLKGNVYKKMIYDNFVATSTVIVRKDLLVANNLLFREGRQGVEDWDLWIRLAEITNFDFIDKPLVKYRIYNGNMSSNYMKMNTSRMRTLDDLVLSINSNEKLNYKEKNNLLKIVKKGRALQMLRTGHELLSVNRKKEALNLFKNAIIMNPFSPNNYWGIIKSLFA